MVTKRKKPAKARAVERAVKNFALNLISTTQKAARADVFWGRALLDTVLAFHLETKRLGPDEKGEITRLITTLECVECGDEVGMAGPYCNDFCKQISGTIRYARKGGAESRWEDPKFHEGLGMRLVQLGLGGYPARERRLSPTLRSSVFERDGHVCQLCGQPATQVDHVHGNSADLSNLRALCAACNWKRAFTPDLSATDEENLAWQRRMAALCMELALRVAAPEPLKCSDDYQNWQRVERSTRGARRVLYKKREEELDGEFEDADGYLARAMAKDD